MSAIAIGVAIVDDDRRYAEALAELLQLATDFEIVGIAGGVRDGIRLLSDPAVDLGLIDVHMADGGGLRLVEQVRRWTSCPAMALISAQAPTAATLNAGVEFIAKHEITEDQLLEIAAHGRHRDA